MRASHYRGAAIFLALSFAGAAAPPRIYCQTNPVPLIYQPLVPASAAPSGPAFSLTVNGTGFVSASVVNWNGSPRTTTFVSGSRLTAAIPATDIATAGTATITVSTPSPGGGTSNPVFLPVGLPESPISLNRTDYSVATNAAFVAAADFNGDGKLDLVIAHNVNFNNVGNIGVLLGNGDGTFQPEVQYTADAVPKFVAVGDFNGDGKLDVVTANDYSDTISVLLGNGDGTFQPEARFGTGLNANSVCVGDFNEDGKLDVVVSNIVDNTVNILLGKGDGTFQARVNYPTGIFPAMVGAGDFNGDGRLDLAVVNSSSDSVSILLGNGDGTFRAHADFPTGTKPSFLVVGDLNGDGKLDVVAANDYTDTISVLLGNGDGTFQPHVDYSTGKNPAFVTLADFNEDGKLDLAVVNSGSSTVSLLLGNGNGSFQARTDYPVVSGPSSIAVGDLNRDGRLDLAVINPVSPSAVIGILSILLQNGRIGLTPLSLNFGNQMVGTSSAAQTVTVTNTGSGSATISSIAVNGADAADFGQTNTCASSLAAGASCTIQVTLSPAQTGPRTATIAITDNTPGSPHAVNLGGVGVTAGPNATLLPATLTFAMRPVGTTSPTQTITLTNFGSAPVSVTGVAASGEFAETDNCVSSSPIAAFGTCTLNVTFSPTVAGTSTGALTITDNAAGSPQVVTLSGTGSIPTPVPLVNQPLIPASAAPGGPGFTLIVDGTGFLSTSVINWNGSPRPTTFVSSSRLTAAIAAADITQPATASVTVTNPSPGGGVSSGVFFNVAMPASALAFTRFDTNTYFNQGGVFSIVAPPYLLADFNHDGKLDLAGLHGSHAGVMESQDVAIFLGNGDGTLTLPQNLQITHGDPVQTFIAADFTGSGNLQFAAIASPGLCIVPLSSCDFNAAPFVFNATPISLVAGDFNQDGKLDVAAVLNNSNVAILLGNGDGTLQTPAMYAIDPTAGQIFTGDFNADGKLDLAIANGSGTISLLLGNGDGTFLAQQIVATVANLSEFVVADLNGDGFLDLVVGTSGGVSVLLGNGNGTFQPAINYSVGSAGALAVGDINTDGKLDVVIRNNSAAAVSVLLGNGDGTLQSPVNFPIPQGGAMAVGDFNGDGRPDLLADTGQGVFSILLQGKFPAISASPATLTFPTAPVGTTSSAQSVTITNTGLAPLVISSITLIADQFVGLGPPPSNSPGDFAQTSNCIGSLAPGATCQVSVAFTPTGAFTRAASLSIADNALSSPQAFGDIEGQGQDFSVNPTIGIPGSVNINAGQTASYSVSIAPLNRFAQTLAVACSGAPTEASCALSSSSITLDGSTTLPVLVTVVTTAPSKTSGQVPVVPPPNSNYTQMILILALFALIALGRLVESRDQKRRQFVSGLALLFILRIAWAATGCGGSQSQPVMNPGTPPGSYTITMTVTFNSPTGPVMRNTQLKLVVQ